MAVNELSLFTGAGGGLLGTRHLLGWRTIGMVEIDDYCQRVLRQRQRDGFLDECPIFGDIRAFISEGCAERYRGVVDVVTAGFPCQDFSIAGGRRNGTGDKNMWPETIECIRVVRPRFSLLENVPGLVSGGYFGTVIGDLALCGYDSRWRVLSGSEVGAPHKRDRVWIVAYAHSERDIVLSEDEIRARRNTVEYGDWWNSEYGLGRVADGMADGLDRAKAIANGQIPQVAATAWQLLTETT